MNLQGQVSDVPLLLYIYPPFEMQQMLQYLRQCGIGSGERRDNLANCPTNGESIDVNLVLKGIVFASLIIEQVEIG